MKHNVGSIDRIARVLLAVVILTLYYAGILHGTPGIVGIAFAAILILTSLVGFCPLYLPFGISTLRKKFLEKNKNISKT